MKNYIMIFIVVLASVTCFAQSEDKYEHHFARVKKGSSAIGINLNSLFDYYEAPTYNSFYSALSLEYSRFFLNRFSGNILLTSQNWSSADFKDNSKIMDNMQSLDISVRYYFFKRADLFVDIGGSLGHVVRNNSYDTFSKGSYFAPRIGVGYSYFITNTWKPIDNRFSLNIFAYSLIPVTSKQRSDSGFISSLAFFPYMNMQIGLSFYFSQRKNKR